MLIRYALIIFILWRIKHLVLQQLYIVIKVYFLNLQEEKIKVNNCDINYVKVGNGGHHALFLPGALGTIWTEGKPQVEGFNREKITLVAWDPPGYGKSRPPEKEFTTDFYEKDADMAYEFMKVDMKLVLKEVISVTQNILASWN